MDAVLKVRSEIYDQFHRSSAGPDYFFKAAKLLTRDEASRMAANFAKPSEAK